MAVADTQEFEAGKHLLNTKHEVQLTRHVFLCPIPKEPQALLLQTGTFTDDPPGNYTVPGVSQWNYSTEEQPSGTLPPT